MPSLGAAVGKKGLLGIGNSDGLFGLNFVIDLREIDPISVADLLAGKIAVDRLRGRDVIIRASAQELRDSALRPDSRRSCPCISCGNLIARLGDA